MSASHAVAVSTVKDVTIAKMTIATILDPLKIERIGADLSALAGNPLIRKIVVDMAGVTHLSSGALGMLVTAQQQCGATDSQLIICSLQPSLRRIFKISKLEKMFTFQKDQKKALEAFGVYAGG